jgi:hypothetical protein
MATYIHMGGVSNAYSGIRMARAHVHGEATDGNNGVLFVEQPTGRVRTEK